MRDCKHTPDTRGCYATSSRIDTCKKYKLTGRDYALLDKLEKQTRLNKGQFIRALYD